MTEKQKDNWRRVYNTMYQIQAFEPWNLFDEDNIFEYVPRKNGSSIFFSIFGGNIDAAGIGCYFNEHDFAIARQNLLFADDTQEPKWYMQNAIIGLWENSTDVSKENKEVLKEIGVKCRGNGNWLHFEKYEERFMPRMLTDGEVKLLAEALDNLLSMLETIYEKDLTIDFDGGQIYMRYYDNDLQRWINTPFKPPACY